MDYEAARVRKLWLAVMVVAVVQGYAVGERFAKVQGLGYHRRSSFDLGIGNLSMDLANEKDETEFVGRTLARTDVVQKQVECKVGFDMLVVQRRNC